MREEVALKINLPESRVQVSPEEIDRCDLIIYLRKKLIVRHQRGKSGTTCPTCFKHIWIIKKCLFGFNDVGK